MDGGVAEGRIMFEKRCTELAKLKRALRKGVPVDLPDDLHSWKCHMCDRTLLSKAGYVNHTRSHRNLQKHTAYSVLPTSPDSTTCAVCGKVCSTSPGLKRHMKVHRNDTLQRDAVGPVRCSNFVCHVCLLPCRSAAGLKSHLRAHGRKEINQRD